MRAMSGEHVTEAVAGCLAVLRAAADRYWRSVRAGRVEWDCHTTAVHVADDLVAYAANLAGRARGAYIPFELKLDEGTDNAGLIQVLEATGALLAAAVVTAPPDVRAFHPYPFRDADRSGFAAMGVTEVLLHTHDMAEGLGLPYEPSAELAESVLATIFPHIQPGPSPWPTRLRVICTRPSEVTSATWCFVRSRPRHSSRRRSTRSRLDSRTMSMKSMTMIPPMSRRRS